MTNCAAISSDNVLSSVALLITYLLTPWCRVLLLKLTGLQLVKKFPSFLWNPKVHYRTHKRPPPVPILGQPNSVHIPTSHLLEIQPNIIHPSTSRSPQWSLSLRFPHQDPIRPLSSPIRATCPAHLISRPVYSRKSTPVPIDPIACLDVLGEQKNFFPQRQTRRRAPKRL